MKILHISDCYLPRLGGIETQVHALARQQRAAGHDAEVLTATPKARHDLTRREVLDGVPLIRATADLPFELPVHPRTGREVGRVLDGAAYDAVHVHAGVVSPFAFAALPLLVRRRVPVVVTVHSLWGYAAPAFRLLHAVGGWASWPVVLSAVSDAAAGPLRRIAGPGVPVRVLPNGIDSARWRVEALPRDPLEVVVVAVMRLAPRKRPMPLLRVLRRMRQQVPARVRVRVEIAGAGPQQAAMERYLRRHGMQGWVRLRGRLTPDELRDVYRRADVFVAPARLESFGIAALEARTAGLPVVARAGTGIAEFVSPPHEGVLASSDTAMAAALARLVAEPELRARIAAHNRAVTPRVTWTDVLARCDAAYRCARRRVAAD
ncbi:MAG TPA: glycosyltransferase family 4 protein [Kineosporiaceae bacterium]